MQVDRFRVLDRQLGAPYHADFPTASRVDMIMHPRTRSQHRLAPAPCPASGHHDINHERHSMQHSARSTHPGPARRSKNRVTSQTGPGQTRQNVIHLNRRTNQYWLGRPSLASFGCPLTRSRVNRISPTEKIAACAGPSELRRRTGAGRVPSSRVRGTDHRREPADSRRLPTRPACTRWRIRRFPRRGSSPDHGGG